MDAGIVAKKDIAGRMVVGGDMVAVAPPGRREELVIAKVTKLTPKGVTVYVEGDAFRSRERKFHRKYFVKV